MSRSIEFPLKPGWWLSLGLKPLVLNDWIDIDEQFNDQMRLKADLRRDRPSEVVASLPQSEAAQQEVLDLLIEHLLHRYPQHYERRSNRLHQIQRGKIWNSSDFAANPLDLAGQLVQEDLCVLLPQGDAYALVAGAVYFPFRWRLQDKLGRSLSGIHAPVPGYAEKLARPVDGVFDRLRPDYPSVRFNWGIADTAALPLPAAHSETSIDPTIAVENAGDRLWLRVERQTLRRLPQTGGVLFTIRTRIEPLWRIQQDAATAAHLAEAIEQLPVETSTYKSLLPLQPILLTYLRG